MDASELMSRRIGTSANMENAPIPLFGRFSPNAMSFELYDDDAMVAC